MNTIPASDQSDSNIGIETPGAIAYFVAYLAYLFWSLENEFLHWLTLVLIPFALIYLFQRRRSGTPGIRGALSTVGLEKSRLWNGVLWAILIGAILSCLQLYLSRNSDEILSLITSKRFACLFPMALGLMLLTAGFTEEFFFRGVLQTRMQQVFKSKTVAVVFTSILFGIYHLPYAYVNPRWTSHGNFVDAVSSALGQGIPMGLILGTVYMRTKNNLIACVLVHSLFNSLPAMLAIRFRVP